MPNDNDNNLNRIRIAYSIATFIYWEARKLVRAGLGEDLHGEDLGVVPEIDSIPSGTDEYEWAHACARFIRYIGQILSVALIEAQENASQEETTAIADVLRDIQNDENG